MTLPIPPPGWSLCLDVSRFQGHLDIPALIAAHVSGLWARATDGLHDVDSEYRRTSAACVVNALPFGAYGVLEPYGLGAVEAQAAHFASVVSDSGATLPPWCDFELAHGLSGYVALACAADWCDEVEARLGVAPMIYTGPAFIRTLETYAGHAADAVLARLGKRGLAVADYLSGHEAIDPTTHAPRVPPPWSEARIWQVGPYGAHLPGTQTPVDVDWVRGCVADL